MPVDIFNKHIKKVAKSTAQLFTLAASIINNYLKMYYLFLQKSLLNDPMQQDTRGLLFYISLLYDV